MRAGITRKYIEKARVLAATQGFTPTESQIRESARLLHEADLAHRRWLAFEAIQGRPARGLGTRESGASVTS